MFITGSRSHWIGVKNSDVSLNTEYIAWTGSRSGSRSDDTTISLEARSADRSGGKLEETTMDQYSDQKIRQYSLRQDWKTDQEKIRRDINLPRGGLVYYRFKITLDRCEEL